MEKTPVLSTVLNKINVKLYPSPPMLSNAPSSMNLQLALPGTDAGNQPNMSNASNQLNMSPLEGANEPSVNSFTKDTAQFGLMVQQIIKAKSSQLTSPLFGLIIQLVGWLISQ